MPSISISLPDQLKDFVDNQVGSGKYASASDYLRDLVLQDEMRSSPEGLEALLQEGLDSEASPMTDQDWQDIRTEGMRHLNLRHARKHS